LLQQVLECQPAESLSYQQAFQRHLELDPLSADKTQLREAAAKLDLSNIADTEEDRIPAAAAVYHGRRAAYR
jgi:lysyl-tRNA synthetase class 2